MRAIGIAVATAILALSLCDVANAGSSATGLHAVLVNCEDSKIDKDARISACDTIIHSNLASGRMLGVFYAKRGQAYFAKGDTDHAMQDFNASLDRFSDLPEALINRAYLFDRLNQPDQALADFDHAVRAKPEEPNAWLGRCYERAKMKKDFDGALSDCNEALRLQPTNTSIMLLRGEIYITLDRCTDAIADLSAVIAAKPNGVAYRKRGVCKKRSGDAAGAKADMDMAQSLDSTTVAASPPTR